MLQRLSIVPFSAFEHVFDSDVFVSTAQHEFFGIAAMEAALAGCHLLLPRRLVYPELFDSAAFYDGGAEDLARRIDELARRHPGRGAFRPDAQRHLWPQRARELDLQLESLAAG